MEEVKLDNWEIENVEDLISSIEEMFHIKFHSEELINVLNFDELSNAVVDKIQLRNVDSCTKQQAFYKIRKVFDKIGIKDKNLLTLKHELEDLLPRKTRKQLVSGIEQELGFKINLIEPPRILVRTLFYGVLISFFWLFIKWQIGFIGIVIFIIGLNIANRIGNELRVESIKELVELITRENYLKVRSEQGTINRKELKLIILDWFSDKLEMNKNELNKARFV